MPTLSTVASPESSTVSHSPVSDEVPEWHKLVVSPSMHSSGTESEL